MIHSLITVIYDAAFKRCSNVLVETTKKDQSNQDETVAIGITPDSASVM